jgi:PST family polysaccharide transporter
MTMSATPKPPPVAPIGQQRLAVTPGSEAPSLANASVSREELREATLSGVRVFTITRAIAELSSLGAAVLLARLVAPSEFGRLAIAVVVSEFAMCIASESLGAPLVQRDALEHEHIEGAMLLGLLIGLGLALLTVFVAPLLTTPLFGARTSELFRLFAPAFALAGLEIVPLARLRRELRFRYIGVVDVVGVLISAGVSVGLAFAGLGAKAYVLGVLVGLAASTAGYLAGVSLVLPRWRLSHMRELLRFGTWSSAAGIASVAYRNLDYMILGARLPAVIVGYYYRAFTIGVEYERKLTTIVAHIAFPVYSRASDPGHLRSLRTRIVRINVAVIYPILALFISVAPVLVPWLFGSRWSPAVLPAQILAIAGMASTVRSLTGPSVLAAGRPRALAVFSACEALLYGATVWIAAGQGLTAVCIAVGGFQLVSLAVAYIVLMRHTIGTSAGQIASDIGPAVVSCIPLVIVAVLVRRALPAGDSAAAVVLLACICGGAAYLLTLRALFSSAWGDLALLAERILPGRLAWMFTRTDEQPAVR